LEVLMTGEEFVNGLKEYVVDSAVNITLMRLQTPPKERYEAMSEWYLQLSTADKEFVQRALNEVGRLCLFGFCAVIDGSRAIETKPPPGEFELIYLRDGERTVLNAPRKPQLMDFVGTH
jgi:hypothetical protein